MINDIIADASLTKLTWVFVYRKRKVILFYSTDADTNTDQSSGGSRIFPGGGANSQKCYYFSIFCQKLHENERIWTPGGGARPWRPPLDPPMQSVRSLRLSNINVTTVTLLRCIETTQACGSHKRTILDYRQNFFLVTLRFQLKQISFIISVCRISAANILIRSYIGSPGIHVWGSSKYKFLILSMRKLSFTPNMLSKHSSCAAYVTILCFCFSFMTN